MKNNKLVVGNLKMYMDKEATIRYLNLVSKIENPNVVICPTSIYLPYFVNHGYQVGIQNIATAKFGAYTGEISAMQAKELGVSYALIGHSERREYFHETSDMILEKIKRSLEVGIRPIFCIGEALDDYKNGKTKDVLKDQIREVCEHLTKEQIEHIIFAYEPVWAIGTGITPTKEEIDEIASEIKKIVVENFRISMIPVLYGGSIKEANIANLESITNIDGYLIGKAATTEEFIRLLEVVYI